MIQNTEHGSTTMTIADKINSHLSDGGVVQVTTCAKSWIYKTKHAGWFSMVGKSLYVRHGRSKNCLSCGDRLLVGIRFGHYVAPARA